MATNQNEELAMTMEYTRQTFRRSTRPFIEEHAGFAPAPGMYTVAQQVAHAAQVIDWFTHAGFESSDGFDMDFEAQDRRVRAITSLSAAFAHFDRACATLQDRLRGVSPEFLALPIPKDQILGGAPRSHLVNAVADHTAHHRGALTVYARLLGLTPPMPYED